ncbi:MAG: DUF3160 domain-containing protein [Symplocastrum torsivum CPER-KK1]|jgi:hypothetical protein|uniref:DUF3160 domain-containing protein n=1 Tax=Symplocastrum torsivum CPER-KK1 TaxID=450513 RepID=A0A951PRT4_9CYAN|nr:DUF3160 domain-containing protein [Symplocastrum torsivum CPER-KK1]
MDNSCLIVAAIFLIIALTHSTNWAALPIAALKDETSNPSNLTNPVVATTTSDTLGYTATFDEELKQIGQISPQDFAQQHSSKAQYLPQLNWDVTTAKFWDQFSLSPDQVNIVVDYSVQQVGDPGSVLHEGVGNVDLLMLAVDNGSDKMVYAGPVLSHYEFEMSGVSRKSDAEWQEDIFTGNVPPCPDWTNSYLVSGESRK